MDLMTETVFEKFVRSVFSARTKNNLPILASFDLRHYCQTLINAASVAHLMASMACSDRLDLMQGEDDPSAYDKWQEDCKKFAQTYLGLQLITQGDPRGSVFKLVVDTEIGDSFGDRSHLCVPCSDAYFCK